MKVCLNFLKKKNKINSPQPQRSHLGFQIEPCTKLALSHCVLQLLQASPSVGVVLPGGGLLAPGCPAAVAVRRGVPLRGRVSVNPRHRHPLGGAVHRVQGFLQLPDGLLDVVVNDRQVEEVAVGLLQKVRFLGQPF